MSTITVSGVDIVPRPEFQPGYCAATLKSEDPKGFVDTHLNLPDVDPHVYVSVSWIEEIALKLGWLPPDERDNFDVLEDRLSEITEELEAAKRVVEAVYALKNAGFVEGRKPGRPPKETVA